ncbi:vWA domain-containing protein [Nesterenkonia ebinurensis]|uniref:vWA domain-containing protein n=1 Tax=Nesterenkonia ebinurensis TaxID=2608252 RepID=UPI00123E3C2A|nr:YfbK domain-containing protein [Nesterenkonia ebinurensis]
MILRRTLAAVAGSALLLSACSAGEQEDPPEQETPEVDRAALDELIQEDSAQNYDDAGDGAVGEPAPEAEAPEQPRPPAPGEEGEHFEEHNIAGWISTVENPTSTVATTTDTASWSMLQALIAEDRDIDEVLREWYPGLSQDSDVPSESVRPAEWVNAVEHSFYSIPTDADFEVSAATTSPLWESTGAGEETQLLRVALAAAEEIERNPVNLTIIIDVSGSMSAQDRLEHVRSSAMDLLSQMQQGDTIALVTFSDSSRVVLEPTEHPGEVEDAVMSLQPGGSTNTASGLADGFLVADDMRQQNPEADDVVVLLADGVANVGETDYNTIVETISENSGGATLHTVGIGTHVYNDELLSGLARELSGTYTYLGTGEEAATLFTEQLPVLSPVGEDVKTQLNFNEEVVESWRMIGAEERQLDEDDLHDEDVRGGFVGQGQYFVSTYEVVLTGEEGPIAEYEVVYEDLDGEVQALEGSVDAVPDEDLSFASVLAMAEYLRNSEHVDVDIPATLEQMQSSPNPEVAEVGHLLAEILVDELL